MQLLQLSRVCCKLFFSSSVAAAASSSVYFFLFADRGNVTESQCV